MKWKDPANIRLAYAAMIALMTGLFLWYGREFLVQSAPFFALGAAYGVLIYRVLSVSVRAQHAMQFAWLLICMSLISVEDVLQAPASGPWLMGFIAGGIAGGYVWLGPRAGGRFLRKRHRTDDGGWIGGWPQILVNAACAAVLLALGLAHLMFQSPTPVVAAVFAACIAAGWAVFRFPLPAPARPLFLLAVPVGMLALGIVGGAVGLLALPMVWGYGSLAGILLGGRYWTGPRFGQPRRPFSEGNRRRRRRPRPKRTRMAAQPGKTGKAAQPGKTGTPGRAGQAGKARKPVQPASPADVGR